MGGASNLMKRLLIAILFIAPVCHAQILDSFGGNTAVPCPANPQTFTGTASQAGSTTILFTVTNATFVADSFSGDYDVTISGVPTFIIGVNEPGRINGTGTAMDFVYNGNSQTQGAVLVQSVNTSTGVITLKAPNSGTFGATAGTLTLGHGYIATVNRPVYGTGKVYCNQVGDYQFPQVIGQMCVQLDGGLCAYQYTISTISRTSNVVTLTTTGTPANIGLGSHITVSGVADSTYDCTTAAPCQVQSISGSTITYNNTGTNGSSSGGTIHTSGWSLKYPVNGSITSPCVAATGIMNKVTAMGFSGPGEDSTAEVLNLGGSCALNPAIPFELNPGAGSTAFIITYASSNLGGVISQPIHDLIHTMDRGFNTNTFFTPGAIPDVFDSRLVAFPLAYFSGKTVQTEYQSPAPCCFLGDDSDNFKATCGSGLFPGISNVTTGEGGGQCWHPGLIVALSAPHETATIWNKGFTSTLIDGHVLGPYLYPDSTNYSKQFTGVKTGCYSAVTLTAPSGNTFNTSQAFCTWPDWVATWYGTTSAMNTSWGSSYTTFGSSETTTNGEAYATGDGTTTTFAHTFAHTTVTPNSIAVLMHGVQISGDCRGAPNAEAGCTAGTGQGNFIVVHTFQSSAGVPVGFVLVDSNSDYEEVTTAGTLGSSAPTWPIVTNCSGTQTTVSGSATLTCIGPAISSGSLTYATGSASITFAHAVPSGEAVTVSYTSGGWDAGGTGLMDEDGSNTAITGTNPVCVINPPAWSAGMTYVAWQTEIRDAGSNTWQLAETSGTAGASNPGFSSTIGATTNDNGVTLVSLGFPVCSATSTIIAHAIDANQNWAQDVTNWFGYGYAAKGFSGVHTVANKLFPGAVDLDLNFSIQSYDVPMYYQALQSEAKFSDAAFTGHFPLTNTDDPLGSVKASYIYNYYTNPTISELFLQVTSGWELNSVLSNCQVKSLCLSSPTARVNEFYNLISNCLTIKSPAGIGQCMGYDWWGNTIFQGVGYGFIDQNENRQNGVENVTSSVSCSSPLSTSTCGGDLASAGWNGQNYDTCTHCLIPALQLWLAESSSQPTGTVARQPGLDLNRPLLF